MERKTETTQPIPTPWGRIERGLAFQFLGDNMGGERIGVGDLLFVDTDAAPEDGHLIVARLNGDDLCRVYWLVAGRVELRAAPGLDEPHDPPLIVTAADDFHPYGVVQSRYTTRGIMR